MLSVNSFMVILICVYALINGVERIRAGGNPVDAEGVIWFGAASGAISLAVWAYERCIARKIASPLIEAYAREWLIDFGFSMEEQDRLRERIWGSLGVPLEEAWLSICLTRDRRWV